jgi:hypothetical protein
MAGPRPALFLDVAVKTALVSLLVFAVARQDLPQFAGKAVTGRAIGYPIATLVVPAVWWFLRRRPRVEYATFIRNSPELRTAYTETLGELALGLTGSILAATLTVSLLWRAQSAEAGAAVVA